MFPRKVPSLETIVKINKTGLTDPQTVALRAGLNVLKPNFLIHARNINVMYVYHF